MPPIVETDRRLPSYRPDFPVDLGESGVWYLPMPRIQFRAGFADDGQVVAVRSHCFGPEYLDKVEAYRRAAADDSDEAVDAFIAACLDLAVTLLRKNYDLTAEEAASLFHFDYGEPADAANKEMRDTFISVALGVLPKKATGDGSSST